MIFSVAAQAKTYFVCLKAGPGPILANICWRAAKTASGLKCRFEMRHGDMFTGCDGMTPSICVQFNLDKRHTGLSSGYQGIADL